MQLLLWGLYQNPQPSMQANIAKQLAVYYVYQIYHILTVL